MGVKILSLYDGMACGMIAMQLAGVEVESYDAYEIDKYAIKTAQHNFPDIKEHGDVFEADFTQYEGVDFGIGGSPCTHWSIAQTKNRETTVNRDSNGNVLLHQSGIGVELFSQFLRMLSEAKPKFFIYENNKSMSKEIRTAITECFGFEPTEINSALVSAQNRQRLYWVGKRNEDGTYSKVNVEQPADRGILLKDVLDSVVVEPINTDANGKSFCVTSRYYKGFGNNPGKCLEKHRDSMVAEPIRVMGNDTKSRTLTANYWKTNVRDAFVDCAGGRTMAAEPINDIRCANGGGAGAKTGLYAVPVGTAVDAGKNTVTKSIDDIVSKKGYLPEMFNPYNRAEITTKSPTLSTGSMVTSSCAALMVETADGKQTPIYKVRGGIITIKGKQYPIKLKDGYYIIRKLTVRECMRLQTVPEWYEFPVSNSQAYKMLGNGWTCEVIAHLIRSCMCI